MAQIRQYSKVTLQSGTGSCTFTKVEVPKLHFCGTLLVFLFSFYSFFYLLIPNRFQSLVFSSNSLETLELLMPARKHILLRSEEYLCSVSNTNRRFKYCSSGVCLCGCVREGRRERIWVYCVHLCGEPRLVVHTKGWEIVWACMCVWHCVCPQRVFLFLV